MGNENDIMASIAPELASHFARYPLQGTQPWTEANATTPDGSPAFIPSPSNQGLKQHYVYGSGSLGKGYYHLTTRASYNILFHRIQATAPNNCCACSADARTAYANHDKIRLMCYYRYMSPVMDDRIGEQNAMAAARGEAQAMYHMTQNAQLVVGGIQLSTL